MRRTLRKRSFFINGLVLVAYVNYVIEAADSD